MKYLVENRILTTTGDITELEVTAIVNAANSTLLGGGGVDGAIHRAGGTEILKECKKIRDTIYPQGMPAGNAVITTGGNLKAKYVIHTVGPVWHGGKDQEEIILKKAYQSCLEKAKKYKMESVAFPAISTGVYHFPKEKAAKIAFETTTEFTAKNSFPKSIVFIFFSENDEQLFLNSISQEKR